MSDYILVFDVGGSHIAASTSGFNGLALEAVQSVAMSKTKGLPQFLESLVALAKRVLPQTASPVGISIAMPNPFDYRRGISYMRHKFEYLYGIELHSKLAKALGCPPDRIQFLNDAAAFLMGEIQQGAAWGMRRVVGITLGTGVGSAFATAGEIVTQGRGVARGGEIWNLSYKDGIVEKFVSALAIQENYEQKTGQWEEVQVIANLSETKPEAMQTFEQFGKELANVLRDTCVGFKPERIILGGGISRSAALFLPTAEQELAGLGLKLCVSQLRERAPLVGAAAYWMKKHGVFHK
jgi:glucokinase